MSYGWKRVLFGVLLLLAITADMILDREVTSWSETGNELLRRVVPAAILYGGTLLIQSIAIRFKWIDLDAWERKEAEQRRRLYARGGRKVVFGSLFALLVAPVIFYAVFMERVGSGSVWKLNFDKARTAAPFLAIFITMLSALTIRACKSWIVSPMGRAFNYTFALLCPVFFFVSYLRASNDLGYIWFIGSWTLLGQLFFMKLIHLHRPI